MVTYYPFSWAHVLQQYRPGGLGPYLQVPDVSAGAKWGIVWEMVFEAAAAIAGVFQDFQRRPDRFVWAYLYSNRFYCI